jgi:hypothetical protein
MNQQGIRGRDIPAPDQERGTMKVKILKACATPLGSFNVGDVVEIPDDTALAWLKSGLAEPSKGKVETAMFNPPAETAVVNSVTDKKELVKEQTRKRVQRYREKQKQS